MTTYYSHGVSLSDGQRQKLARAYQNKSAITIRLNKSELTGNDELMLNKKQLNRIKKAMNNDTGVDIKISKTQIRKAVKHGGSLWSSLISLGTKLLPYATKAVTKAVPALATGAMSALGSLGIDKMFGKGQTGGFLILQDKINQLIQYKDWLTTSQRKQILDALQTDGQVVIKPTKTQQGGFLIPQDKINQLIQYKDWLTTSQKKQILDALQTDGQVVIKPTKTQQGGFLIPQDKINQLIQYKDWLTTSQKKQILDALQTGGQVVIKPTKTQQGGFLGTLLASIGVPLLLNALTGKGLQVDSHRSRRSLPVYVPPAKQQSMGGLINPYAIPPPFYGT